MTRFQGLRFKIDAYGLDMLVSNVEDDIKDAWMFYNKLARHIDEERELKGRVIQCIHKITRTLKTFKDLLDKHNNQRVLSTLLGNGAKIKKLVAPLQASQSQLARRIDWMRAALDKGFDPPKDNDCLPSSVPPSEQPGWVDANE